MGVLLSVTETVLAKIFAIVIECFSFSKSKFILSPIPIIFEYPFFISSLFTEYVFIEVIAPPPPPLPEDATGCEIAMLLELELFSFPASSVQFIFQI